MQNRRQRLIGAATTFLALAACQGSDQDGHENGSTGGSSHEAAAGEGGLTSTGGENATGTPMSGGADGDNHAGGGGGNSAGEGSSSNTLSDRYPGDEGLADDPAVLFFDDFEAGWGRWTSPDANTEYLHLETDPNFANSGEGYLRSTVTMEDLQADEYISSSTRADFPERVDQIYFRFHVQFKDIAPNPHHWVRIAAGTESWSSSGLANTVPPGDEGFWFDFDTNQDDIFNFYVYWYKMRSGRCNDGSTTPGCEGDQGTTYHYGNSFRPLDQTPFPRDMWFCVEMMARANTVGESDGALAFWIDDELVGDFRPGHPEGTWLRDSFHPGGCDWSACTEPVPFEGFDFRSDDNVRFKQIFLDAYYERGSANEKKEELEERGLVVSDEQTIYYDDVVVATQRIGCKKP